MSSVRSSTRGHSYPATASCDLDCLVEEIKRSPARGPDGRVHGADLVSASIVLGAGELQSSHRHGVGAEELQVQVGSLLSDLVRFAALCDVDVGAAIEDQISLVQRSTTAPPPLLRQV